MAMFMGVAFECVAQEERLYIDDFTIKPGEQKEITVNFDSSKEYTGFQCDMKMPDGLTIALDEDGELMLTGNTSRFRDHMLAGDYRKDIEAYRFLSVSFTAKNYRGTSGAFFYITLQATADMTPGEYKVDLEHIIFSKDGVGPGLPSSSCVVTVEDSGTGVNDVQFGENDEEDYYTIQGIKIQGKPKAGLYIHNGKKVVVR